MIKILVIHGPNLNLLGAREPDIYGKITLKDINKAINNLAKKEKVQVNIIQSNSEGDIIESIHKSIGIVDALVINAGAYTHTSLAIADAIRATKIPTVEIHISNIFAREKERHYSCIASTSKGVIAGFGIDSYLLGLQAAINTVKKR